MKGYNIGNRTLVSRVNTTAIILLKLMAGSAQKTVLLFCMLVIATVAFSEKNPFVFDKNEYNLGVLKEGRSLTFNIPLQNITGHPVKILSLEPSCGCTEATVINRSVGTGKAAIIRVTIDTAGKIGKILKTIEIMTDAASKPFILELRGLIKHTGGGVVDSGAIFRGNCRRCHVGKNIKSKHGEILFDSVCFMCHKDYSSLGLLSVGRLKKSISNGLSDTSMPGFSETDGGPLNKEQIDSLVKFLKEHK